MVSVASEAAAMLGEQGIDAGVINMSTVKPLDEETLLRAAEGSRLIVTAEEHSVIGGLGGAVCEFLSERHPIPVRRIGVNDCFGCSGKPQDLLRLHGLTAEDIVRVTQEVLGG